MALFLRRWLAVPVLQRTPAQPRQTRADQQSAALLPCSHSEMLSLPVVRRLSKHKDLHTPAPTWLPPPPALTTKDHLFPQKLRPTDSPMTLPAATSQAAINSSW